MIIVVTKGIKHASYAPFTLTINESVIVMALIITAFYQYWGHPAHMLSWDGVSLPAFTPHILAIGVIPLFLGKMRNAKLKLA